MTVESEVAVKEVRRSRRLACQGEDSAKFKGFGAKDNNMISKKRPDKRKRREEGEGNKKKKQRVQKDISQTNTDNKGEDMKLVAKSLFQTYHDPTEGCAERVYDIGHKLGSGRYGNVYYATTRETLDSVAIKTRGINTTNAASLKAELQLMKPVNSEHVIKYIHHGFSHDKNYFYLTMEYVDGMSVYELVRKVQLDFPTIATITKGIFLGLEHLHGHGIMHRDIKGDNVLVSKAGGVKIADFGCAIRVGSPLSMRVGTPRYMAPELIFTTRYDTKVDVWAAGMTLLEMINRKRPYAEVPGVEGPALVKDLFKRVLNQDMPRIEHEEKVPKDAKAFMTSCGEFMGEERPTASELLQHKFLKSAQSQRQFSRTTRDIFKGLSSSNI